jgi:hypothetical protein
MPLLASHHGGSLSPLYDDAFSYYLPSFLPLFNTLQYCAKYPSCHIAEKIQNEIHKPKEPGSMTLPGPLLLR